MKLPDFLDRLLAAPPPAGQGVHNWLFRVARQLHAHLSDDEIFVTLKLATRAVGRHVSDREIRDAIRNSRACAWQPRNAGAVDTPPASKPTWPKLDPLERQRVLEAPWGYGLADLWEESPVRIEDNDAHTEEIIDALFPGNPLLCCGSSVHNVDTKPREAWRGQLAKLQFIVPSPMTAVTGRTQDGRDSKRCLENVGARRFLVVEFDGGSIDEQAKLIRQLAVYGPLCLVVHSGGKSLHGWFYAAPSTEEQAATFFQYACRLGADPATWNRVQMVRMPDGLRDNGKRQTVSWFDRPDTCALHPLPDT
jgi:hypothetical protein